MAKFIAEVLTIGDKGLSCVLCYVLTCLHVDRRVQTTVAVGIVAA